MRLLRLLLLERSVSQLALKALHLRLQLLLFRLQLLLPLLPHHLHICPHHVLDCARLLQEPARGQVEAHTMASGSEY